MSDCAEAADPPGWSGRRDDLPRRPATHVTDKVGVLETGLAVERGLRWVFRDQPVSDYGIDAHIEVVDLGAGEAEGSAATGEDDRVTGQLIGVQAKSGKSFFEEPTGSGWVFRESHRRHLSYWLEHSLPVIVTLYRPEDRAVYWQAVTVDTVRYTAQGFTLEVPGRQRLDAASRPALEDIARRRGPLAVAVFDRSLRQLPPEARGSLRRAADRDRPGAARLAQTLADGRGQPRLTASSLLAAAPHWLAASPVAGQLWNAVAGFCVDHQHPDLAAHAFQRAAEHASGPLTAARLRAFAGLALLTADQRDAARPLLARARADGAVLLADVGLAQLDVPADDARVLPVPPSLQSARPEELDREPTVLNFLAELRLRDGDLPAALALMERAVSAGGKDSGLRLRLAELLRRRVPLRGVTGSRDVARARDLAESVLRDTRAWSGPSVVPLQELLDLDTLVGDLRAVVVRCSPTRVGGTATDDEAADPTIAQRGAQAARLLGDDVAVERFLETLASDPRREHVAALALELGDEELDPAERAPAWQRALDMATDDREKAVLVGRLSAFGRWPLPAAEDLRARSVVPGWAYRLWELKATAVSQPDDAVLGLRLLAPQHVPAAVELIDLLERLHGPSAAYAEWCRQSDRWRDVLLLEMLPDLVRRLDRAGQLDAHVTDAVNRLQDAVGEAPLPAHLRLRLRRLLLRLFAAREAWDRVVRVSQAGLAEQDDNELAWHLVAGRYNLRRDGQARSALLQHRLKPGNEQQVRLWARLLFGTDLEVDQLRTLVALVDQYGPETALGGQLAGLAVRELTRLEQTGGLPDDLRRWQQQLLARPVLPGGLRAATGDELAQELAGQDETPLQVLRGQVAAGQVPLAALAAATHQPYGQVLLQRTAGLVPAADLEPGLQQAGRTAARVALDSGAALADLSALYLLLLLDDDGQVLQALLPDLQALRATAVDASASRDAVWTVTGPMFTVSLQDGQLHREDLSPAQRALLRGRAIALEDLLAHLPLVADPTGQMAAGPSDLAPMQLDTAQRLGLPLYADDVALRQQARARAIATFGTVDLLHEAGPSRIDRDRALVRLAREDVVDLPLSLDQLTELGHKHDWQTGPTLLLLARASWWRHHAQDWPAWWRHLIAAATQVSGQTLLTTTTAAVAGAVAASSPSLVTQRYQQLLVHALDAVADTDASVPPDLLQQLAERHPAGVAPRPRYIHAALVDRLRERGVPEAPRVADRLLPGAAW